MYPDLFQVLIFSKLIFKHLESIVYLASRKGFLVVQHVTVS